MAKKKPKPYQEADGWAFRLRRGDIDVYQSGFKSQAKAQKALGELIAELEGSDKPALMGPICPHAAAPSVARVSCHARASWLWGSSVTLALGGTAADFPGQEFPGVVRKAATMSTTSVETLVDRARAQIRGPHGEKG